MTNMKTQKRRNRLVYSMFSLLLVLGLTGLLGCKKEAASTPARPIPEVPVVTVSPGTMPDEPEFIGQTEASRPVEIRSQVTGILKERFFAEGRDVKQGDQSGHEQRQCQGGAGRGKAGAGQAKFCSRKTAVGGTGGQPKRC